MIKSPAIPENWPLMLNNITRSDLDALIEFLKDGEPILTQSNQVREFEQEWSNWLGVKHSVFVNSGSSANEISMCILKEKFGNAEIIVPPLTWVSDIAAVLHAGLTPVFCDIQLPTLALDPKKVIDAITPRTKAVFLTHILGYNGLTDELISELQKRGILLIEDACESHGASHKGKLVGSFGYMSNFSFYYAHHMSTIEGGMICSDDPEVYQMARMFRAHGMVRESNDPAHRQSYQDNYPDLNPDFIFAFPAHNMRSTEINAVIGRKQLLRLNQNNQKRSANLKTFLENLNKDRFYTEFKQEGSSNYAFTLLLRDANQSFMEKIMQTLRRHNIEFRRGTSGGGNQLRQPYLRRLYPDLYKNFPVVEHVHFYGMYIGNYPDLSTERVFDLCQLLNSL